MALDVSTAAHPVKLAKASRVSDPEETVEWTDQCFWFEFSDIFHGNILNHTKKEDC